MRRVPLLLGLLLVIAPAARALGIRQQQCFYMRHSDAGCTRSNGMQGANDVVVSPDGRNVYAVSGFEDYGALLSFRRDPQTGELKQLPGNRGCISSDGRNAQADLDRKHGIGLRNRCGRAGPMAEASSLAISPDGLTIYVLGGASFRRDGDSLVVFRRDPATGFVHELQCRTRLGTPHCPKTPFDEPRGLAVAPDATRLYVGGAALTQFVVDADGRLAAPSAIAQQALPFVSDLAVSPDSATIYASGDTALAALRRDGTVAGTQAVDSPRDVAVAPDGAGVYVAAANLEQPEGERDILHSSALLSFAANPLARAGCAVYEGRTKQPSCDSGPALYEAQTIAITPDGLHAVAGFIDSAAVLLLDRDPVTQRLTPVAGRAGCVRSPRQWVDFKVTAACNRGHGLYAPLSVTVSPDGRNAYLASDDGLAVFSLR